MEFPIGKGTSNYPSPVASDIALPIGASRFEKPPLTDSHMPGDLIYLMIAWEGI